MRTVGLVKCGEGTSKNGLADDGRGFMTGYTVHTGATEKFVAGWDRIFKGKGAKSDAGAAGASKKTAARKAGGKKKKKAARRGR